jgi:DUF4097 and DUF4098 domain-containing protein YvlB
MTLNERRARVSAGRHSAATVALSVSAVLFAAPACIDLVGSDITSKYVEREEKHFATAGTPDISLSTFDGSIEVRAWDKPEVEVIIEKHAPTKESAAAVQVDAGQDGNQISVEAKAPNAGFGFHLGSRSAKLIVSAPAASNLVAKSGDGSIDVDRISGRVELRSGDGSIHGRDLGGDVKVHTGDGAIKVEGMKGALDVDTGDGTVVASGRLTALRVRTGDGSIDIRAEAGSSPSSDWDISTGDGSIVVALPDGFDGELDAHTGDGRVHVEDVTLSNVSGEIGKSSVRGRLGSGGRVIRLRTGDGSITLRQ